VVGRDVGDADAVGDGVPVAAGSAAGASLGALLLGRVPAAALVPALAVLLLWSAAHLWPRARRTA
jgi:uncharacterized membrane protein YfcA